MGNPNVLLNKTARRAENPARPQILLGAYRTPTTHTVYDLSLSFKAISDSDVEPPYIISNHKKSPIRSVIIGAKSQTIPIHPLLPRVFFFKMYFFGPEESHPPKMKFIG